MTTTLRTKRLERGLKSSYVAKTIGVSKTTYHQYELTPSLIKLSKAYALSEVLDTPIDELFKIEEISNNS